MARERLKDRVRKNKNAARILNNNKTLSVAERRALGLPISKRDIERDKANRAAARAAGNLKRLEGGALVNQHQIVFSPDDKKALDNLVRRANKKRLEMLVEEAGLPRMNAGHDTGDTVATLLAMGRESDFILARKTASLQRFKTKDEYYNYIDNLKRVLSPTYIEDRVKQYKRNHMKALENVFGDDAKDVKMKIHMMKPADYMRLIQSDEMLEIGYIYDPSARSGKLNQIRASLGMKLKEEEYDEEE